MTQSGFPVSPSDLLLLPSAVQTGKAPLETLSDAEGHYTLSVPAGDYTVVFSGPGVARQELPVTVQAGVKKRVDGVVGK